MPGRRSKSKGYRRENGFVKLCEAAGLRAWRVPLSGGAGVRSNSSQHDVIIQTTPKVVEQGGCGVIASRKFECEVKARANGQGFTQLNNWIGNADVLILVEDAKSSHEKPRHMAYLDANLLLELLNGN